ncbi:MAG: response regulator transcription factor [Eubacteriales bacterium]|nr:response regulator transcription factor [Eubacteriales bacterium]
MEGIKILIVEDDRTLANELKDFLSRYGYMAVLIQDFSKILKECMEVNPDLVLMDINLPFYDGFYWCSQIREFSQMPIIYISSRNSDSDKIMAIAQGGDDFVEKPFNLSILKAKIEAIIRRTYQYKVNQKQYIRDHIYYDSSNVCICYKNQKMDLTKSENIIIKELMEQKNRIVSRNALMDELWNTDEFVSDNTLTVLISRLRAKLKDFTGDELIGTKKGQGYYIE